MNFRRADSKTVRYFFRVEYDGIRFGGWQYQPNADSVQAQLERAISTATRIPCRIVGSGRTDAGVHARGQGAHFDLDRPIDCDQVCNSINGLLPYEIAVYGLREVPADFHARFWAIRRTYRYTITTRKSPLLRDRAWFMRYAFDWDLMKESVKDIPGSHDFSAFCSSRTSTKNMTCTVERAELSRDGDVISFLITADRYIYKMVRSLVGTLVDIARGDIEKPFAEIIASRDRTKAGTTAPPWGLSLEYVEYPEGVI